MSFGSLLFSAFYFMLQVTGHLEASYNGDPKNLIFKISHKKFKFMLNSQDKGRRGSSVLCLAAINEENLIKNRRNVIIRHTQNLPSGCTFLINRVTSVDNCTKLGEQFFDDIL